MEYVTTPEIGYIGKTINTVKDAVTYFGIGSMLGNYEGYDPPTNTKKRQSAIVALEHTADSVCKFCYLSIGNRKKALWGPQILNDLGRRKSFDFFL